MCECHMLSQPSINVNREIQQGSMLCTPNMSAQICCTKVWLDGHSNMLELVRWEFFILRYSEEPFILFFCLWTMIHGILSYFKRCGAFFTSNVTNCKQPCDSRVIAAVKKKHKYLLLKDVLSFYQLDNDNQHY